MLNTFPNEVFYSIIKWVDLKTFSSILMLNKTHYSILNPCKWDIIDTINKPGSPVPLTIETYNNYKYMIDWITVIYNKIHIPESVIEIFMKKHDHTDQINKHLSKFDLKILLKYQKLSSSFIVKYYHLCDLETLILEQNIPEELLVKIVSENNLSYSQWHNLLVTQKYSLSFIEKNLNNINWYAVSCNKDVVTTEILIKYYDNLVWPELTKHGINQELIELFIHKLDNISWTNVAFFSKLSSDFIIKYKQYLNLQIIFRTQELKYDTIYYLLNRQDEFDKIESWINIALYQSLDYDFIFTNKHQLELKYLIRNPRIKRKHLFQIFEST